MFVLACSLTYSSCETSDPQREPLVHAPAGLQTALLQLRDRIDERAAFYAVRFETVETAVYAVVADCESELEAINREWYAFVGAIDPRVAQDEASMRAEQLRRIAKGAATVAVRSHRSVPSSQRR
jgi:hypothetical protein